MNRKVEYVRLQTPLAYPGVVGEIGSVLPSHSKVLPFLDMTWCGADGLVVSFVWHGVKRELVIPSSNVVLLALYPEAVALPEPKSVKAAELKVVKSS